MSTPATPPSSVGRRPNPVLRLFSSIRFGVVLLFLILTYAALASALPQIRGALEMTEMEIFRHWLFGALVALFCAALLTATVTRIRWNLSNAGVLTVHTGLLLLVGGAAWYFGTKVEGDVLLRSPRVELIGGGRVLAELPAEPGQSWSSALPALGGDTRLTVLNANSGGSLPVAEVTVRARVGQAEAQTVTIAGDARSATPISDRLALRLRTFPAERSFYDSEAPALYHRKLGEPRRRVAEIRGLPFFRERYLDEGYVLRDSAGRAVPSKRASPHVALGGVKIPTGWFEHWRMPIKLDAPGLPFDVEITGYVPYVSGGRARISGEGARENPAIEYTLRFGARWFGDTLFARDPARLASKRLPIEFRWVGSAAERDELLRPLAGAHELHIEVRDPPVNKTVAVSGGQKIEIEGTPYELTIERFSPSWEVKSPGFEGAVSPIAQVSVTDGAKSYRRTVVERFPQLTQDVDEQGVRYGEGPYDPNLVLRYRTSASGLLLVVAGPGLQPVLGVFDTDGALLRFPLTVGKVLRFEAGSDTMTFTLNSLKRKARAVFAPTVVPLEVRRPRLDRQLSAIRLKLTGRGPRAGWSESRWCFFSPYPHVDARPIVVRPPGETSAYELTYSRLRRDLGVALVPHRLKVALFPGGRAVESWWSDFLVQTDDGRTSAAAVYTNQTYSVGRWALFQSGAASDRWSYTILGVGNRNGIWAMNVGWVLVALGCLYAFYVKPILRRRSLRRAVGGGQAGRPVDSATAADRSGAQAELVEVGP